MAKKTKHLKSFEVPGQLLSEEKRIVSKQKMEVDELFKEEDKYTTHEIVEEFLEDRIIKLEKAIARKEAELLRSRQLSMRGVMASGLAHEIIQPLQIILAISQNCQREIKHNTIDSNRILEDLKYIAAHTKRIDHIVNHLHVLSRESKPKLEKLD